MWMLKNKTTNELIDPRSPGFALCPNDICEGATDWDSVLAADSETDIIDGFAVVSVTRFRFSTDSEVGTIDAATFAEACDKLQKMVPESAVAEGAWGWVEDVDGKRFWLGK